MKQTPLLPAILIVLLAVLMTTILSKAFLPSILRSAPWTKMASSAQQAPVRQASTMSALSTSSIETIPENVNQIHLIILVHGWMGNSVELGYLQTALEKETNQLREIQPEVFFLVHSAISNDGRTSDGIAAGGERLGEEVTSLIRNVAEQTNADLSLSFVGNSLGGLYARYALSKIPFLQENKDQDTQQNNVSLQPKIFCTTATPHLGVSDHTYLPIPRSVEYVVAHIMRPTGRDLFRHTNLIEQLATDPLFVEPLKKFEKRIAYANAFQTDFQVPTATAAFLSETDSVHRKLSAGSGEEQPYNGQFVSLAVETPRQELTSPAVQNNDSNEEIPTSQIAERLDALGWHKIFFDVRETLPSVPIVRFGRSNSDSDQSTSPEQLQQVNDKDEYSSKELLDRFVGSFWSLERFHLPFGHSILVANSKNEAYAKINAAGQPIMDQLAADLVRDIMRS